MTRTIILRWVLNQSQIHPAFLPDYGIQWCQQIFTWPLSCCSCWESSDRRMQKIQHFQVVVRRKIYRNSTRLTSATSNNRALAPRNAGIEFFEHLSFLLCRYIKEKGHGVITRLKCSITATSKEVLPTHSPGFLQNLSLPIKLLSCHVE